MRQRRLADGPPPEQRVAGRQVRQHRLETERLLAQARNPQRRRQEAGVERVDAQTRDDLLGA